MPDETPEVSNDVEQTTEIPEGAEDFIDGPSAETIKEGVHKILAEERDSKADDAATPDKDDSPASEDSDPVTTDKSADTGDAGPSTAFLSDAQLLQISRELGVSEQTAQAYIRTGQQRQLQHDLTMLAQDSQRKLSSGADAKTDDTPKESAPLIELSEQEKAELDPLLVGLIERMEKAYRQQLDDLKVKAETATTAPAVQAAVDSLFEGLVTHKTEYADLLGKTHVANREKVINTMVDLKELAQKRGEKPVLTDLFERAVTLEFGREAINNLQLSTEKAKADKVKARSKNMIARAGGMKVRAHRGGEDAALVKVAAMLHEKLGGNSDAWY